MFHSCSELIYLNEIKSCKKTRSDCIWNRKGYWSSCQNT